MMNGELFRYWPLELQTNNLCTLLSILCASLVILQLAALLFFGVAMLLRRLTAEPVERIRITLTAFCAIPLLLVMAVTPLVPHLSIALWHEPPVLQQTQVPAEIPTLLSQDMPQFPQTHRAEAPATLQETQESNIVHHPDIEATPSPTAIELHHAFPWLLLAQCGAVAGFFAVAIVMIVFHCIALARLRRIMQPTLPAPEWVVRLFRDQTADCQNTVTLRVSPHIDSPLLCGLFRPMIVLPMSMTLDENSPQTHYALAHELAHHRNGDLRVWHLVHACRLLFWVQPFYWHLARELRIDQDFLADDAASRINASQTAATTFTPDTTASTDAEQYASVLVELAKRRFMHTAMNRWVGQSPVLGFADTPPLLTRRIEMLLKEKKRFRGTTRLVLLLAISGLFLGLAVMLGSVRFTTVAATTLPAMSPSETADEPQEEPQNSEPASLGKFDRDTYVPVRGRVVVPEGETLERASLLMRALSSDNEMGLYGTNENVMKDGTFQMQAHANANYAIIVADRENPSLTSKVYHLEIGDEAPKEEVVIPLVKATAMIEGQVLNAKTGKPIPEFGLVFCQYFEIKSKKDGKALIWPLTYYVLTDREGKFQQGVLPGNFSVGIQSAFVDNLFFNPQTGYPKNFWTTNWNDNKPTPSTAFQVKEGETIKPVLRIPPDSPEVQKDILISGHVVVPGGTMPENLSHIHIRILTHDNNTNYGMNGGGFVSPDGKFTIVEKANRNYAMNLYDTHNEWAAKPLYIEVGPDTPMEELKKEEYEGVLARVKDMELWRVLGEHTITLEKGTLIEGIALDHATGKPLADTTLVFFEYFDATSKMTGGKRRFPINSRLVTDADGKFRRAVVPGLYGVSTEQASTTLFIQTSIEKAKVTDPSDWEKPEERPATVFEVKPESETVRPILRIVK
jgi:beta-lactamase regulating signal transducer with metallopeptidase domain